MKYLTCITVTLAAVTLSSSTYMKPSSSGDGSFELLILHNNDMHARFEQTSQLSGACTTDDREAGKCYGGFPRVAHVVKEARRKAQSGEGPPVLYLNAGDTYTGTAWFTIYKWKIAAEFINALQPDAVSLGNHELDNGIAGLTPFIRNLTCPVLAANLILNNVPDLEAEHNLMKSVIFDINGTKVGVIGYLTPDTKFLAQRNKIEYIEEVAAIKQEVAKLKMSGINIIVALGHSGFTKDLEIAKHVDGIDIVIGGHTNTFLWNGASPDSEKQEGPYPTVVKQASGRSVAVVQAYAYTKYIGKLHIVFDSVGEIIKFDGNPILLDKLVPQDPEVLSIIDLYKGDIMKISGIVDGNTSVILDGDSCRVKECNMGNLITNAMVYKYATEYKGDGWTDTPIAVIQGGGIRASISHIKLPAVITRGDLLSVMPFGGHVVKLEVNGTIILSMFEHAVYKYSKLKALGQFLQVSGLKVVYNLKNPPGKRVINIKTLCGICKVPTYSVLNKNATYNILMPVFLALGGDGFSFLSDLPSTPLVYDELDSTTAYLQGYSPMYQAEEDRIVFKNEKESLINSVSRNTISLSICLLVLISVFLL